MLEEEKRGVSLLGPARSAASNKISEEEKAALPSSSCGGKAPEEGKAACGRVLSRREQIERSIITACRKGIWGRFVKGVKEYALVEEGDRIAVCISGGKDSMLLAKCMQELHRHSDIPFELHFLTMDPGYAPQNRALIEENAQLLGIPLHIFDSPVFAAAEAAPKNACYLCARMRRGYLYEEAQRLGCNKIALGHHFDDVIQTILMGMLYGAQMQSMPPKLWSTNHPGMQLIRPLYYVHEEDIVRWKERNGLRFLRCACRFTERCEAMEDESKRAEVGRLIAELKKTNPNVDINIFRSAYNVHVDTLIEYDTRGKRYGFLERYAQKTPQKEE